MEVSGEFCVSVTRHNGVNIVEVAGELDLATAARLRAALDGLSGPLLVDCDGLTFLDASGLRVLADVSRWNPTLTLRHIAPEVRRVLDIVGMDALRRTRRTRTGQRWGSLRAHG